MKRVFFEITVPIEVKKEEGMYISCCPVLDLYSQGATESKARDNAIEAIRLFFISCFERGTLDAALAECGFRAVKKPVSIPKDRDFVKVPIPFDVTGNCAAPCHA